MQVRACLAEASPRLIWTGCNRVSHSLAAILTVGDSPALCMTAAGIAGRSECKSGACLAEALVRKPCSEGRIPAATRGTSDLDLPKCCTASVGAAECKGYR